MAIQECILTTALPDNLLKLYQICFVVSPIDVVSTWSFALSWLSNWGYNNLLLPSNFSTSGSQGQGRRDVSLVGGSIRLAGVGFHIDSRKIFCISLYNLCTSAFRWACCYFIYYLYYLCCCRRFCSHKDVISSCPFNQALSSILFSTGLSLICCVLTFYWAFINLLYVADFLLGFRQSAVCYWLPAGLSPICYVDFLSVSANNC